MASQITGYSIVHLTICSGAIQRKDQSSASLAFVWGIHWSLVDPPHKGPVTRKTYHLMTLSCYSVSKCAASDLGIPANMIHYFNKGVSILQTISILL